MPALCPACRREAGAGLCQNCQQALRPLINPCPFCATPRPAVPMACANCFDSGLRGLRGVQVSAAYDGVMGKLISDSKAGARPAALRALATHAAADADPGNAQLVIPVPPNPGRRDGQHLATACAAAIAKRHKLPLLRCLRTTRSAAEQHRLLGPARQQAVEGLFVCKRPLNNQRVLLVDDIYTSGSTLIAASKALRLGGARTVHAYCLARTIYTQGFALR